MRARRASMRGLFEDEAMKNLREAIVLFSVPVLAVVVIIVFTVVGK